MRWGRSTASSAHLGAGHDDAAADVDHGDRGGDPVGCAAGEGGGAAGAVAGHPDVGTEFFASGIVVKFCICWKSRDGTRVPHPDCPVHGGS